MSTTLDTRWSGYGGANAWARHWDGATLRVSVPTRLRLIPWNTYAYGRTESYRIRCPFDPAGGHEAA